MRPTSLHKKGFTLIELLIVIAIIGLISTVAVITISTVRQKPRNAKRVADVKAIQKALELFYSQNGGYPVQVSTLVLGSGTGLALCGATGFAATCTGTSFMTKVPAAPTPEDGATCTAVNNAYRYTAANNLSYTLTFCIGSDVGAVSAGPRTASPVGIQ